MNTLAILFIALLSLLLGLVKYGSISTAYKGKPWQLKFIEIWNDFFNFLITGCVAYYFFLMRWPALVAGGNFYSSDFVLFVIFGLGVFGHLCVMSKNITDGIEAILKRILNRE